MGDTFLVKEIRQVVPHLGFSSYLLVANSLIDMYGKCMFVEGARWVFEGMAVKDVISWTSVCSFSSLYPIL